MNQVLTLLCAVLVFGCATKPKAPIVADETSERDFDRATRLLNREDFSGAAEIFDRLLVNKPATEIDLMTSYNAGAAYEGMGQCGKAVERYRQVARSSAGKFPRLEAQSLYRASLMYECLGMDVRTIATLLDARKRSSELQPEVSRAELPARLAAAYSRAGNRAKALEYFGLASEGLKAVLADANGSRRQKEILGQTLYQMGRLNPAQRDATAEPMGYLLSLSMQQPYLLQAVELAPPKWAERAENDLSTAYRNLGAFNVAPAKQREFGLRALQVINELKKIRMSAGGPGEDEVFAAVEKAERSIQNQLNFAAATLPLTPEAELREGPRREGRPVSPTIKPTPGPRRTQ